ncbi:hypothetical protein DXG01_006386 [Tephrocybe rancida]|nr:hypothetical protein DXG01_006386 [Tephrocybe rancida]
MQEQTQLDAAFEAFLDFNPPEEGRNYYIYPKLAPPLTFYDKHLDERLSLKKAYLVPSLANDLSEAARRAFEAVKEELPPVHNGFPSLRPKKISDDGSPRADAREMARKYQIETSYPVSTMASMLLLHPNSTIWTQSLCVMERPPLRRQGYTALNEDFSPRFLDPYVPEANYSSFAIKKEAWDAMTQDTCEEITQASNRFRCLAVWQMFYMRREARRALKRMDSLTLLDTIPVPSFRTSMPPCAATDDDLPTSPDALNIAWGTSVSAFVMTITQPPLEVAPVLNGTVNDAVRPPPRRSTRISSKIHDSAKSVITSIAPKVETLPFPARRNARPIAQWSDVTIPSHAYSAWSRAVERDSTFIVLHCGTYERIAFRHRASRTLFISELIDVKKCSNPGYGAIHAGLYISIIKDVLERTRQLIDAEANMQPKKRKRQALHAQESRKRPKTRAAFALEENQKRAHDQNFKLVSTEIANRPLALLRIQHTHFNSPVPASFLRYKSHKKAFKLTYKPEEYFCITLTSQLGVGGTGDAHEGFIDLLGPAGKTSLLNIVVKFAFRPDERQRLRHESKVYRHLSSSGVSGIPHYFGLFKDVEGDTLALVITKGGTSLPKRKPQLVPYEYDSSFSVSMSEKADFIKVLESIHAAGVRHRDIRGANLVVNDDGVVNIIDFDRASLNSSRETMQREMQHLISMLDGGDDDVNLGFLSSGSFRESGAESMESGNVKTREKTEEDSERTPRPEKEDSEDSDWDGQTPEDIPTEDEEPGEYEEPGEDDGSEDNSSMSRGQLRKPAAP